MNGLTLTTTMNYASVGGELTVKDDYLYYRHITCVLLLKRVGEILSRISTNLILNSITIIIWVLG